MTPASLAPFPLDSIGLRIRRLTPGLVISTTLGIGALCLADLPLFASHGLGALTLAIVLGLAVGNTVYPKLAERCHFGVGMAKQQILRTGIVLYGLRLTFQDIAGVGWTAVAVDTLVVTGTFGLACWLGQRWLGIDRRTTLLIGAGSSICGAAAVLATAPVVKGRPQDVAVAIATVVVFGTVSTFLYPALFHWNAAHGWLGMDATRYGIYVGATVHEVAQVVAAGAAVSHEAADTAVIVKMIRVMMLAPFLLFLSWWLNRIDRTTDGSDGKCHRVNIPWFALGFVAVAGIQSLGILPLRLVHVGVQLDNLLLAVAMAALGLTTHVRAVRAAGFKPLLLAALLFAWLVCAGLVLTHLL